MNPAIASNLQTKSLIGDQWIDGGGETMAVTSRWSGRHLADIRRCTAEDADRAVAAARAAQREWGATSLVERVELLRRMNQLIVERGEAIAQMETLETGKTINETRE